MSDEKRRAAGILAQCKWLRDQISAWERQAKEVLAKEVTPGERVKAVALDGTEIGSVTRAEPARSMQIDNEEGFLMWVKQRYPHEVTEEVRAAFIKLCAEKVKVLGCLPDANGEPCPHVSLARSEPSISARMDDQQRALIEQMFMSRHMPDVMLAARTMSELKAITYGDNPLLPPYDGPLEDTTAALYGNIVADPMPPEANASPDRQCPNGNYCPYPPPQCQHGCADHADDPQPFIEEGPPNWPESNTFETSDRVRQRRGEQ